MNAPGLDGLVTYRLWRRTGLSRRKTRCTTSAGASSIKADGVNEYVWVLLISGAAPPAHFIGGWKGASSERQPPMYFRLGGGTLKGISKPGAIVWSRVFIMDGKLHCDLGVAEVREAAARRKPSAAGAKPLRNGPSCTRCSTASPATK